MPFILNLLTTTAAIEQRLSSLTNPRDLSNAYSVLQEAEDALEKAVSLGPTRLPQHIAEELISDLKRISAAAESSSTRKQEQKVLKDAQDFRARVVTAIRKHQATEIYSPQSYDYLSMETSTERPGGKDFHPELEKVEDEQHKDITVVQESPLLSLLHGAGKAEGRSDCNDNVDGVRVGPLPVFPPQNGRAV
ncbi:hypothetical protein GYMLUDRAFT_76424 [Collybiopsis luxurians FD-317 M1]|uniref:Uncharacterized protein n=1 Tax=Collybiopsis luxurians FD-317 M1 TaxID=944289 RepID=A0A0D0C067_9AGAR|nr:hypothetical protein GYMLUDRAFT_76424 [Collybiopsis luxurians FD-317 M1]